MTYQQFVIVVKETVAQSLGDDINLQIHTTLKNNSRERVGITITSKQSNISPTIYLEEYYKQFQNGLSLEQISESIQNVYHEIKFKHTWQVHTIKDFEAIQSKIVYKLIHAEKNEKLLQTTPYISYLDLAIVFYILFDVDESGTATIPITDDLIQLWDTNLYEIHRIAIQNAPKILPITFKPMRTVIDELLGNSCSKESCQDDIMFVLTNSLNIFGAASILYDGVLEDIGKQFGENYYVLPSSIHEVILVPESQCPTKEDLNDMVMEINETQVDAEEVLSNHAYYYDCEKKQLS